ncbi:MAG: IS1634 family transposase [Pleurocapsa sp. CRU_1_2]|nr:IS1634 family transposase [Pleurocapsa sp. CRU_1_2]
MKKPSEAINIVNLDHLGIVAGIIDEMELVEEVNKKVGIRIKETLSPGQVMKAMILNGLGFLSAPIYLFDTFFVGKATEHLIGEGVTPEQLNDDRIGRALDKYYQAGTTKLFMAIAMKAALKFQVEMKSVHLDSSSISVEGAYKNCQGKSQEVETESEDTESDMKTIKIVHGYSRDRRPDLKQFIIDTIVSGDGDVPLYLKIDDGNTEAVKNPQILSEYKAQQSNERGFRFIKDPLFFTSSVFVKKPERVEAIGMIMGLCLLVYNLAQRKLRQQLSATNDRVKNQVKKLTDRPTMRWIFQVFQAVHLVTINGAKQVSNLTQEHQNILRHLGEYCCQYYLIFSSE